MNAVSQPPSVAIAGAGLAGLCLAQALVRAGFDVKVYERDSSVRARPQGYRLTIDAHGTAALKFCLPIHLFEAVRATASAPGEVGYFRFTNQNLSEIFKLTFRHRADQPTLGQVDRATLRTIMLSGLEDRVHFGKTAAQIRTAADAATLHFTDGTSVRASILAWISTDNNSPKI
jgi:2-polyprenyl-6-methoxyphenol hydroxylase-like FAD-dependent oxidoreductase